MESGLGIEVYHDFSASHHGSGPVDNYGKDGRRAMDDDVACGDLIRYNYEHCFDWCTKWMPVPSDKKKHLGTFGANGTYIWRAYSKLGDANPRGFPVVGGGRDFQRPTGSNEIYAWRATHSHLPQLEALFVPCYCTQCRSGAVGVCKYRHITHSLVSGLQSEIFITHVAKSGGAAADGSDSD